MYKSKKHQQHRLYPTRKVYDLVDDMVGFYEEENEVLDYFCEVTASDHEETNQKRVEVIGL